MVGCVNLLTVAINDGGRKRLCIDMSRDVNDFTMAVEVKQFRRFRVGCGNLVGRSNQIKLDQTKPH